jgi:hypothetical protein
MKRLINIQFRPLDPLASTQSTKPSIAVDKSMLIEAVCSSSSRDPEPPMASRRQHELRSHGIEFRCLRFAALLTIFVRQSAP